jgi:non-ribosomal peptide synthetase component F
MSIRSDSPVGSLLSPAAPAAGPLMVEELFERRSRENPDAAALISGSQRLSYAELDAAANRLGRRLMKEGVGPESLVGIHLDRSFELVAAILAVLKAGAARVPIDPDYPEDGVRDH